MDEFVAARKDLRESFEKVDRSKTRQSAANRGDICNSNPPQAPNFRGVNELL